MNAIATPARRGALAHADDYNDPRHIFVTLEEFCQGLRWRGQLSVCAYNRLMVSKNALTPGQVLRHQALGTEAFYRVLSVEGATVSLEVLRAPGLTAGAVVRWSLRTAAKMQLVDT